MPISTGSRSPSGRARSPACGSASPRRAVWRWSPAARSSASARSPSSPHARASDRRPRPGAGDPRCPARRGLCPALRRRRRSRWRSAEAGPPARFAAAGRPGDAACRFGRRAGRRRADRAPAPRIVAVACRAGYRRPGRGSASPAPPPMAAPRPLYHPGARRQAADRGGDCRADDRLPFPRPRIVVEAVGPDEADALADIHAEAFARPWSRRRFRGARPAIAGSSPSASAVIRSFWPPRLIGFVLVRVAAGEAEILSIAVHEREPRPRARPAADGRSAAPPLSRTGRILLSRSRSRQPGGGRLYRSLGFETVGERKGYYHRLDGPAGAALVMRLKLR